MNATKKLLLFVSLYFVLLPTLLCTDIWATEEPLSSGSSALDKPVTLAVKGESLADIATMLSDQTGLKFRVTKDIADQKATIFVDNRPVKFVMDGLEIIFGYRWSIVKSGNGEVYELWETANARRARQASEEGATAAAFQKFDSQIRQFIQISSQGPDKVKALYDQYNKQWQDLTPSEREQFKVIIKVFHDSGLGAAMGKLYLSLKPDVIAVLQSGGRVYFDTDTPESEWRIPKSITEELSEVFTQLSESDPNAYPSGSYNVRIDLRLRGDKLYSNPVCSIYKIASDGTSKSAGAHGGEIWGDVGIPKPQPVELQAKLPGSNSTEMLGKPIAFTAKELVDEAALFGQTENSAHICINRSDLLSLLHRKMELQVISDHYTGWFPYEPNETRTVRGILDDLGKGAGLKVDPRWGYDGTCLYLRERFPYEMDATEIPNRLLKRWKASLARDKYFGLDDLADITTLPSSSRPWSPRDWLLKIAGVDYSHANSSPGGSESTKQFKFYASLNSSQRRLIASSGLSTGNLSMPQADYLVQALAQAKPGWDNFTPDVRRVGVYNKYGYRIDKPEADIAMPVFVKVAKRESNSYTVVTSGVTKFIAASSPADAWKQFKAKNTTASKESCFFGRDAGYTLVAVFRDGTSQELPLPVYVPIGIPN